MGRSKKAASLSPEVESQIAEIQSMALEECAALSSNTACKIVKGEITAKEGNAISRAVGRRLKEIETDFNAGRISL